MTLGEKTHFYMFFSVFLQDDIISVLLKETVFRLLYTVFVQDMHILLSSFEIEM